MTTPKILIIDVENNTQEIRDYNEDELAQHKIDADEAKAKAAADEAEAKAKVTAKKAAEYKLSALGLTTDDLRALGL